MGDSINDAPALYAADASISVDTATDLVKESADFVLLEKDLFHQNKRVINNTEHEVFAVRLARFTSAALSGSTRLFWQGSDMEVEALDAGIDSKLIPLLIFTKYYISINPRVLFLKLTATLTGHWLPFLFARIRFVLQCFRLAPVLLV